MKSVAVLLSTICLAGCVSASNARRPPLPQAVIYAYTSDDTACYVRYLQQLPLDRICVQGDNVRYSAFPDPAQLKYLPMPAPVDALFNSMPVERVLQHRRSLTNNRNPAERTVN